MPPNLPRRALRCLRRPVPPVLGRLRRLEIGRPPQPAVGPRIVRVTRIDPRLRMRRRLIPAVRPHVGRLLVPAPPPGVRLLLGAAGGGPLHPASPPRFPPPAGLLLGRPRRGPVGRVGPCLRVRLRVPPEVPRRRFGGSPARRTPCLRPPTGLRL